MIDDAVGRVLNTVGELNLAEDTTILFTADHGLMHKGPLRYQSRSAGRG